MKKIRRRKAISAIDEDGTSEEVLDFLENPPLLIGIVLTL
jgi:hypothetical protein|tara:strand:- start:122 stop:241 length:120 start_codon:yes stop_codon:yes gene_type:complete